MPAASVPSPPPVGTADGRAVVPVRDAMLLWLGAWLIGNVLSAAVAAASGHTSISTAGPGWLLGVAVVLWLPLVAATVGAARKFGDGNLVRSFGLSLRPVDLLGVVFGAVAQLALLPALYWPLRHWWPGTFSTAEVERRARETWESASGAGVVLLVLAVVIGAPIVEELVYRGLLQGSFAAAWRPPVALLISAALFAAIHFQPIETPGLFVIGLVLGGCTLVTRRLGMGILAHMTFNATGLLVVAMAR